MKRNKFNKYNNSSKGLNSAIHYENSNKTNKIKDETLKSHLDFLRNLFEYEEKRRNSIDERSSVMMSHLGIILPISCLILTFFIENSCIDNTSKPFMIIFIILTVLLIIFYIFTIYFIYQNYNATNFNYSYSSPENVKNFMNLNDFMKEEINDLLYGIDNNTKLNNKKLSNLNIARNFLLGSFCLIIILMILSIINPIKDKKINIQNEIKIQNIDKNFSKIQEAIIDNKNNINNQLSKIELKLNNINNKMPKVEK